MAVGTAQDSEEDTANCTTQNTAYMALATTPWATAPLVLAMDSVRLVSVQAVLVRGHWLPAMDVAVEPPDPPVPVPVPVPVLVPVPPGSDWLT